MLQTILNQVRQAKPHAKVLAGLIASGVVYVVNLVVPGFDPSAELLGALEIGSYFGAAWLIEETNYKIVLYEPDEVDAP